MRASLSRMLALLGADQKREAFLVIAMMFVMGGMDLAGVTSILPFLAVLGNPEVITKYPRLHWLYTSMGFADPQGFLRFLGGLVFCIVLSSIAVRAATFYMVTRFARSTVLDLTNRLLAHYLAQPYEWFLGRHSADLSKTLLSEVSQVVSGSIAPAMRIAANGIVAMALLGLLVWLAPVGAGITVALTGGLFGIIYMGLRRRLLRLGADRRLAMQERFQLAQESMGGIKEVKLIGLEESYRARFYGPSRRLAQHQAALALTAEMPRYVLEALAFGGVLLFILWVLWTNDGRLESVLPVIGAFAFTGLKLMPVMQSLFRDLAQLRFGQAALEELTDELSGAGVRAGKARARQIIPATPAKPLGLEREIALRGVSYRYPGADRDSLHDLTLAIPARSSIGFVGPSGAGKTTLIDVVLGLLRPARGQLEVDGTPIETRNLSAWQRSIGYVPQTIYLTDDTIAGNIAFGVPSAEIDHDAVRRAGAIARLDEVVGRLPEGYGTMVGEAGVRLSGGQRQRIGIARALYRDPPLIVFDEAMSALDTVTERAVLDALDALHGKKTLLTITHRLSTIVHCDRIFLLEDGRVSAEGRYDEIMRDNPTFRALAEAAE